MIKSFKCKKTELLFANQHVGKFAQVLDSGRRKLKILHAVVSLNELKVPPGNKLEALRGNRKGQHSIRVNDQWRLCFIWKDNHAHQVELVDYHS